MKRFSLFALAALLIGCTQNDSQIEQLADRMPIKISLEKSRANDTAFESGDQVGLYVVNYNGSTAGTLTSTENHVNNACFTLSTDWRAEEELYWKDASTKADFYAYYPYGNPTDVSAYPFCVNTDQSAEADYWASDFLWGKCAGVAPTKNAVTITTEHLLSNALVYIKAGEGYTAEELATADVEVKICNIKNSATINLGTGVATATGSATEITPWNTGAYYRAMIVPQTVSSDTNLVSVKINGKEYAFATDITFTAGTQHKIEVTVSAPSNGLVVNFSIKEWNVDDNIYSGEATYNPDGTLMPANNEIWYTSTDGNIVTPYETNAFGVNIVSNTYENGKGIIKFDGDVTKIGDHAFEECIGIESVSFPKSVTLIGKYAFSCCTSLQSVAIPNSVTSIGAAAFCECSALTDVQIPNSVVAIGDSAFGCTSITDILIPESVYTIGAFAFYESPLLMNVVISNGVKDIGTYAFASCETLTSVTIPDSITEIEVGVFAECPNLTNVEIPNSVIKIGAYAFCVNASLKSIVLPESIVVIGEYAFGECVNLKEIFCKATTPPTMDIDVFSNEDVPNTDDSERKIYVPAASVEAYKSANGWSDYASYIEGYDF